ncbi:MULTISPECIES: enoyl-CoA hydratase/isomerase family protein [unclassified Mesorhizobium]|uniref:enoyl-CoA hydratase/isomerase family protein n=1 Tax=unclassified Mesorhizobium TaxID=325217 RepID=UPI0013E05557|nr:MULTISPECIES: enoyl-CoA hydratase/isomerase family protein [unclassified Mesorhizobium]
MTQTRRVVVARSGEIVTLTLDRPEKLNAIDHDMIAAIDDAVRSIEDDDSVRAVVVTGTGREFSVGADIGVFSALGPVQTWNRWVRRGHSLIDRLAHLRVPVIGALNGMTFGGGLELALALDFCIAAREAKFGAPEVRIGTVTGWGGSQRLTEIIGPARAKQMIFTGQPIDSTTALQWGLINEICDADKLIDRAMQIAKSISANAPVAVQVSKQMILGGQGFVVGSTLESLAGGFCKCTQDGAEGLNAFLEKRHPEFRGE